MKKGKNVLFKKLYNKKLIKKIDDKINLLGITCKYDVFTFLNVRFITLIFLFIYLYISFEHGYIISIIGCVVYYFLFEKIFLDNKIKRRASKLNVDAIYFFEVLTLSLQTGRNLAEAISITINSVDLLVRMFYGKQRASATSRLRRYHQ